MHFPEINSRQFLIIHNTHTMHTDQTFIVYLTHWGRVTHICVGNLTIMGSGNGLSPGRRQAIIWTNAGILLFGPLRTNCSEILIKLHTFSSKKMHLILSSAKWRSFCLGLNVLTHSIPEHNSRHFTEDIRRYNMPFPEENDNILMQNLLAFVSYGLIIIINSSITCDIKLISSKYHCWINVITFAQEHLASLSYMSKRFGMRYESQH